MNPATLPESPRSASPTRRASRASEVRWAALDPEVATRLGEVPTARLDDVSIARAQVARRLSLIQADPPSVAVATREETRAGMRCITYSGGDRGTLLYLHGGGFVTGTPEAADYLCRRLAIAARCTVINPEYPLAPEHPYPAAVEALSDLLDGILQRPAEEPSGGQSVAVGGISAGANLAANLALRFRGSEFLVLQLLDQPVVDPSLSSPSARSGQGTPVIDQEYLVRMWDLYLGGESATGDPGPAGLLHEDDLSGLPPAHITVASNDPLRDEALQFAGQLLISGVSVELHLWPGTVHGFTQMSAVAVADSAVLSQAQALERAFRAS